MENSVSLLSMRGITKRFPGVLALDDVSLTLGRGEILALIGENGAGKSTLMKILSGDYPQDRGTIEIDGEVAEMRDSRAAIERGVVIVHQELCLAPNLDVASNIFLGHEPKKGLVVDKKRLYDEAKVLCDRVGITVPITTPVEMLSPGEQQLVEIAKALSYDVRILILDEPTSSLSEGEAEKLFDVMRMLKSEGVSIIYVSHRLHEIELMCDRATVLRDGKFAGELPKEKLVSEEMVKLMVGRNIDAHFGEHKNRARGEKIFSVKNLVPYGGKGSVDFDVYRGEVFAIAGLVGAGRTELLQAIFGAEERFSGNIYIDGKIVRIEDTNDATKAGLALVPEDRKELGVLLEMGVDKNITITGLDTYRPPFADKKREDEVAAEYVEKLDIKTPSLTQEVCHLSGGNQQKVALGKWLAVSPKVLMLDEPTRGIDVGSKSEIYKLIEQLVSEGIGVIMVSSEMAEVIALADRVLVMHERRAAGILEKDQISEENIMTLATGGSVN